MLQYDLESQEGMSLYEELARRMRADITSGTIAPDEHLPSKRDFARALGVSVITVEHAYQQLVAEGYVRAVQRKGYFANDIGSFAPFEAKKMKQIARAESKQIFCNKGGTPSSSRFIGSFGEHTFDAHAGVFIDTDCESGVCPPKGDKTCTADHFKASKSFLGSFYQNSTKPRYDLTGGVAPGSFSRHVWGRILREVVEDSSDDVLLHSAPLGGLPQLREVIARHVARSRDMEVSPGQVFVGAGAQAFYPIIAKLLSSCGSFAVENPGYPTLSRAYEASGVKVHHVPVDDGGIRIDDLRSSGAEVAHVMPSHHFPTGSVMPIARRYELLAWASESHNHYLVEDDYDCEFRHQGRPIPALQGIDVNEKVIYLNTFTRTIAPSLRLGYMVLPPHLVSRFYGELGFVSSSVSVIEQLALTRFISEGHFDKHVNRMRRHYRQVRDGALSALAGSGLEIFGKDAGLHFVLDCGQRFDKDRLLQALAEEGVLVRTVDDYCYDGLQSSENTKLVICYATLSADEAVEALSIIRKVIEQS